MYTANHAHANAENMYRSNEVLTASKKKLVVLLYEGAIKNLKLAKIYMAEGKIERTNTVILKAQNILTELMSTLNFEDGGDIAKSLFGLYQYVYQRTLRANIDKDTAALEEALLLLDELRDAWSQI